MSTTIKTNINGKPVEINGELISRYDQPVPRYTSYPPVPRWSSKIGSDEYGSLLESIGLKPISLYIHYPFCKKRCAFCGCNAIATKNRTIIDRYIAALVDEMSLVTEYMLRGGSRGEVTSIHFGGGSPDYIPPNAMSWLIEELKDNFEISDRAEISIEVDPAQITVRDVIRFRAMGFNRLSLGVQDLNDAVLSSIGRRCSFNHLNDVVTAAGDVGYRGVALDLVYGLPNQNEAAFRQTVDDIVGVKPDRIAAFNFAYLPKRLPHQQRILYSSLPTPHEKIKMFAEGVGCLTQAGYEFIGLDHFARQGDSLTSAFNSGTLSRTFQGYVPRSVNAQVGLGVTAISEIGDVYVQNHKRLSDYLRNIESGKLAASGGHGLSQDDKMRKWIIERLMCYGRVDIKDVKRFWNAKLTDVCSDRIGEVRMMLDDGILDVGDDVWRVTEAGRFFVRNIANLFDNYRGDCEFSRGV